MAVCERVIGTPEEIAAIIRCAPKSPYGWRWGSLNRDAGDIPSARHMRALLAYAAANDLPLTAEDLIWGVSEDMLEQRLKIEGAFLADSSASMEQPEDLGEGDAPSPIFSFRSRAGQHGPGVALQADAPTRSGIRHPAAHPISDARQVADG
jgi:hypothetical protein